MAFVLHRVALIEPQRILVLLVSGHLRAARSPRVHFSRGAGVLALKRLLHHNCIDTPCVMPLLVDAPWFVALNLSHFITKAEPLIVIWWRAIDQNLRRLRSTQVVRG